MPSDCAARGRELRLERPREKPERRSKLVLPEPLPRSHSRSRHGSWPRSTPRKSPERRILQKTRHARGARQWGEKFCPTVERKTNRQFAEGALRVLRALSCPESQIAEQEFAIQSAGRRAANVQKPQSAADAAAGGDRQRRVRGALEAAAGECSVRVEGFFHAALKICRFGPLRFAIELGFPLCRAKQHRGVEFQLAL